MASNESFIGLSNGAVVRGRAINRVRPDKRWSMKMIQNIKGTPAAPANSDDHVIESFSKPHANAGDEARDALDGEGKVQSTGKQRARLRKADLDEFGPSPHCPKCRAHRIGNAKLYSNSKHTEPCRLRFYKLMKERETNRL